MMYFVRMTRSRSKAMRFGELSSSAKTRLGRRRHDAGAENSQAFGGLDQPELDRVPVEAREIVQVAALHGAAAALAIGLQEIGVDRIGEQRHMAEDIVEDVRLLEIVELVFGPDEGRRRESAGWRDVRRKRRRG